MLSILFILLLLLFLSSSPTCPPLPADISSFAGVSPIEVVSSREDTRKGLMHRTELKGGMLFAFPREQVGGFWMKNTPLPLHIDFYDRDQRFLGRRKGVPFSTTNVGVSMPYCYVLETERK